MSAPVRSVHTAYAQRIVFGPQALEDVPAIVKEAGARRVLLVTTAGRLESDAGARLKSRLGRVVVDVFSDVSSHVPTSTVEAAVRAARTADVDGVVSFGGGSCADLGKAVCWFLEREAGTPGTSYIDRPLIAHVAVPTTYSGAELTPFFGMTDVAARRKTGGGGPTTAPLAAVYDPVLTLDLPARVSAETGMNALAHGVEAAYSPRRTPEASALALACIAIIAGALPAVVDDPFDIDARTRMLQGAMLGARALHNAGMGVHHGLAQLLGGRTGIAHGLANAVLLSHCVQFNLEAIGDDAAPIGAALGVPDDPAGALDKLRARLGLPASLADCGVTIDDLDAVARMSGGSPAVQANIRPVSEDDARAILAAAVLTAGDVTAGDVTGDVVAVLLHGQPGAGSDWDSVVEAIAGRIATLAPDRPGYGSSGRPACGVAGNTHAVLDLLDAEGVEQAVIVGYSWAGAIAIDLAARHPDRVRGIVLPASVGGRAALDPMDRVLALPVIGPLLTLGGLSMLSMPVTRRMVAPVAADKLARPTWGSFNSFVIEQRALADDLAGIVAAIPGLTVPSAVIIGDADKVIRPALQMELAERLPGARVTHVPGCGHLLPWEAPGVIADAVLSVAGKAVT